MSKYERRFILCILLDRDDIWQAFATKIFITISNRIGMIIKAQKADTFINIVPKHTKNFFLLLSHFSEKLSLIGYISVYIYKLKVILNLIQLQYIETNVFIL